jgi:hypothetical protein
MPAPVFGLAVGPGSNTADVYGLATQVSRARQSIGVGSKRLWVDRDPSVSCMIRDAVRLPECGVGGQDAEQYGWTQGPGYHSAPETCSGEPMGKVTATSAPDGRGSCGGCVMRSWNWWLVGICETNFQPIVCKDG